MKIWKHITKLFLAGLLGVTASVNAATVPLPALDIEEQAGDTGVFLDSTNFNIDATAFGIANPDMSFTDIPDADFILEKSVTVEKKTIIPLLYRKKRVTYKGRAIKLKADS